MNMNTIFSALFSHPDFKDITLSADDSTRSLSAAFLVTLCGPHHPLYKKAEAIFKQAQSLPDTRGMAEFFTAGCERIRQEFMEKNTGDDLFRKAADNLEKHLAARENTVQERDSEWALFFPEAVGIIQNKEVRKRELRQKRTVEILRTNRTPIVNPGKELIFTSNIILTLPAAGTRYDSLNLPGRLTEKLKAASREEQLYFYDHPIQIGTAPENNEILYGLNGLNETCRWEKDHGTMDRDGKLTCILSVSVTHKGLQTIAKEYIHHEITNHGKYENLEIYVFTEEDTGLIVNDVLIPALNLHGGKGKKENSRKILAEVFGVDGEYGRHYSFLKAIAAFWQVFMDPGKRGTFKIDLDQIFPEKELREQTGKSAFEHFTNPLWGATGKDAFGNKVHLGMIAGALVNERDIGKGIFTPDVPFSGTLSANPEEHIFYSKLLMGFSTEAELMTRYGSREIDGETKCIQRIHVTGGTNGILINYLRAYRPFTPGFIGRAEDQCYLLSVLSNPGTKLAYLHEDGLIMRHDKEAFAGAAIKAASFGSTIGDYVRILFFSRYVEVLTDGNIMALKKVIDPFTGCFVSKIPVTIVYLRFAFKSLEIFSTLGKEQGETFLTQGIKRIENAIRFTEGTNSPLSKKLASEKEGWNCFYDILDTAEAALKAAAPEAAEIKETAVRILNNCRVNG